MASFIFGGNTGISSPKALAERRDLVRALAARSAGHVPQNPWEGLAALSEAVGQRVEQGRLDKAEAAGKASGDAAFAPLAEALSGNKTPDAALLTGVLSSEWLTPGQRSQAETLYERHLEATKPMTPHQKADMDWRSREADGAQANADRAYDLDMRQQDISRANAGRPELAVTDVAGKRVVIDMRTGRIVRELGASPNATP